MGYRPAGLTQIRHHLQDGRIVRNAAIQEMFADCAAVAALLESPSPANVTLKDGWHHFPSYAHEPNRSSCRRGFKDPLEPAASSVCS
jgi:hypothetical protein